MKKIEKFKNPQLTFLNKPIYRMNVRHVKDGKETIGEVFLEKIHTSSVSYIADFGDYKYLFQFPEKHMEKSLYYDHVYFNPKISIDALDNGAHTVNGSLFTSVELAKTYFGYIVESEKDIERFPHHFNERLKWIGVI